MPRKIKRLLLFLPILIPLAIIVISVIGFAPFSKEFWHDEISLMVTFSAFVYYFGISVATVIHILIFLITIFVSKFVFKVKNYLIMFILGIDACILISGFTGVLINVYNQTIGRSCDVDSACSANCYTVYNPAKYIFPQYRPIIDCFKTTHANCINHRCQILKD